MILGRHGESRSPIASPPMTYLQVNLKDGRGITPLMQAAVVGSREAMKLLIDRGADVNAKNAFDSTALMDGFQWLASATLPGTSN